MKVTPVAGTPTIQQPAATGLSPEKLNAIKMKVSGNPTPAPTEEEKEGLLAAVGKQSEGGTEIANPEPPKPKSAISDASVPATEAPQETEPISPQLAMLAKQRRALQVKEKELADKEKALSGNSRADLESRLKSSPLSVLQELGVTYDQLTQEILGNQSNHNPVIDELKAEIKALKEGVDNKFSEANVAQETQAINYVADKLDALMATGDDFQLLKDAEGEEEVIRRIYSHWKKTGKELSVTDVAKEYQDELIEEATRYARNPLVQKRLTPAEPAIDTPTQQTGMRTLTNKDSARPNMDRRQRAILAMQGQLKR